MKKYISYGRVFLGCMSFFMYGVYSANIMYEIQEVEAYRWILTGFFGLYFLVTGIKELKGNGQK